MIRFTYDRERANQAILWFLHRLGGSANKLKLVKLVFFADREHLLRHGRPIAGGQYYTMKLGPVSSELLNDVDGANEDDETPFQLQGLRVISSAPWDDEYLSESDQEVLESVFEKYGHHDRFYLSDLTHDLELFRRYDPKKAKKKRRPLPYEAFFLEADDQTALEMIREDQGIESPAA